MCARIPLGIDTLRVGGGGGRDGDRDREIETETKTERDRDTDKDRERQRQRQRETETKTETERQRQRNRDKERHRDIEIDRDRGSFRETQERDEETRKARHASRNPEGQTEKPTDKVSDISKTERRSTKTTRLRNLRHCSPPVKLSVDSSPFSSAK